MKYIEWSSTFGEGEIVAQCDNCKNEAKERYEFYDNDPDYGEYSKELRRNGWLSCKIHGSWFDFCCEKCRNTYIKNNA